MAAHKHESGICWFGFGFLFGGVFFVSFFCELFFFVVLFFGVGVFFGWLGFFKNKIQDIRCAYWLHIVYIHFVLFWKAAFTNDAHLSQTQVVCEDGTVHQVTWCDPHRSAAPGQETAEGHKGLSSLTFLVYKGLSAIPLLTSIYFLLDSGRQEL